MIASTAVGENSAADDLGVGGDDAAEGVGQEDVGVLTGVGS